MKLIKLTLVLFLLPLFSFAQAPAVEVRAVWLTTNWGLDWPTQGTSVENQKAEMRKILDQLKAENFNTIIFQVRAQGRVFYKSSIEPLSPYFNHSGGFDPLAFTIAECHQRGLECHAWLTTFPMERQKTIKPKTKKKAAVMDTDKPAHYKAVDGLWHLDPGYPETKKHVLSLVKEIVTNYDIDGIHLDYIRYTDKPFPDKDSYQKYGKGKKLEEWRRDNINSLVFSIYDNVKSIKNWVQVSSAPLGRYKMLPKVSPNDKWTAYEAVFQDAGHWMKNDKHDLVFPMMYHKDKLFYPYLDDWKANSHGRIIVPGLGVFQMDRNSQNWALQDITDQMNYTRANNIQGQAYFRTGNILKNLKGLNDSIKTFYQYPAKLPALTWLDNVAPNSPLDLEVYKDKNGVLNIKWNAPERSEDFSYTVYFSTKDEINPHKPEYILATGVRGNTISFPIEEGDFGFYYSVTASDRYHNESVPCISAYFSHSSNEQ